jgi:hypothetical protein
MLDRLGPGRGGGEGMKIVKKQKSKVGCGLSVLKQVPAGA